ncbi:hypothetical protein [Hymenobacter rubripertinctus]|nr:hypothetical protein [Hymenobacter rubripertinctus]
MKAEQITSHELVLPDATAIVNYGRLIVQALVAIVTVRAAGRKAWRKSESVSGFLAAGVVAAPAEAAIIEPLPDDGA